MSNTAKIIAWTVWSIISPIGITILTDKAINRYIDKKFKEEVEKEIQVDVETEE